MSASFDWPINCAALKYILVKQEKTNAHNSAKTRSSGHPGLTEILPFTWKIRENKLLVKFLNLKDSWVAAEVICGVILVIFEVTPPCVLVAPLCCQVAN